MPEQYLAPCRGSDPLSQAKFEMRTAGIAQGQTVAVVQQYVLAGVSRATVYARQKPRKAKATPGQRRPAASEVKRAA